MKEIEDRLELIEANQMLIMAAILDLAFALAPERVTNSEHWKGLIETIKETREMRKKKREEKK